LGVTDRFELSVSLRLEFDAVSVVAGLIQRFGDDVELNLSVSRAVWGANLSAVNVVSIGMSFRAQIFEVARAE